MYFLQLSFVLLINYTYYIYWVCSLLSWNWVNVVEKIFEMQMRRSRSQSLSQLVLTLLNQLGELQLDKAYGTE